jgi:hypothetical protein
MTRRKQGRQQIPFGDDNKKSKGEGKTNAKADPSGMTTKSKDKR